jgi:hypothetical protein
MLVSNLSFKYSLGIDRQLAWSLQQWDWDCFLFRPDLFFASSEVYYTLGVAWESPMRMMPACSSMVSACDG